MRLSMKLFLRKSCFVQVWPNRPDRKVHVPRCFLHSLYHHHPTTTTKTKTKTSASKGIWPLRGAGLLFGSLWPYASRWVTQFVGSKQKSYSSLTKSHGPMLALAIHQVLKHSIRGRNHPTSLPSGASVYPVSSLGQILADVSHLLESNSISSATIARRFF